MNARTLAASFLFGLSMIAIPQASFAASKPTFLGPIVPKECHCDSVTGEDGNAYASAPDFGCVMQTFQNVINFAVTIAIFLATFYLVIASFSFMLSGQSGEALSKAKTRLLNVFVGLAVLLGSWLIVDYVMKQVYDSNNAFFGPWNSIVVAKSDTRCIIPTAPKSIISEVINGSKNAPTPGGAPDGGSGAQPGTISGDLLSDAATRKALQDAGITIANWNATKTMDNTRADTVNQLIALKQACGCNIQVNATTGGDHKANGAISHGTGYKADLQPNGQLDSFLRGLTPSGSRSDGTKLYKDKCGNEYARESTHWDIKVDKGTCSF
jgi:hypothetical protein